MFGGVKRHSELKMEIPSAESLDSHLALSGLMLFFHIQTTTAFGHLFNIFGNITCKLG